LAGERGVEQSAESKDRPRRETGVSRPSPIMGERLSCTAFHVETASTAGRSGRVDSPQSGPLPSIRAADSRVDDASFLAGAAIAY
jgi:hypothetical protein